MKKIFLVLVVLVFAVPTLAAITVTAVPVQVQIKDYNGNNIWVDTDEVAINWTSDPNVESRARAFALDITVTKKDSGSDPNIESVGSYHPDYYIYPGSIVINATNGTVTSYGTPIAAGGPGNATMTIEMGSLYASNDIQIPARRNPPPASGTLLKFKVKDNTDISIAPNVARGGVVRENGQTTNVTFTGCDPNIYSRSDRAMWRSVGRPKCWCRGIVPRQCHGDTDNRAQGKNNNVWVYSWDVEVLRAAYNVANLPPDATIVTGGGDTVKKMCADFDHTAEGKLNNIRVYSKDMPIFRAGYNRVNLPDPNCL